MRRTLDTDGGLQLSARDDFEICLNFCLQMAKEVRRKKGYWKFLIIGLHSLIQSAMVNFLDVRHRWKKCSKRDGSVILKAVHEMHGRELTKEERQTLACPKMDYYDNLYKKCVSDNARPGEEQEKLKELTDMRNSLMHYGGDGEWISFELLREIACSNIPLLKFLVEKITSEASGWYWGFEKTSDPIKAYDKDMRQYQAISRKIDALVRLLS